MIDDTVGAPGFAAWPDLASRALGGGVVGCNDEFFAPSDSLVDPAPPTFTPRTFGAKGQVYDGWETRRRRQPGHDWAIVRLGVPGVVRGVVVDTAFFTGNYPPSASVEGCLAPGYPSPTELERLDWVELVPRSPLRGDSRNPFDVVGEHRCSHVRLRIYPDGGVARLRVHGEAAPGPGQIVGGVDLAAIVHGGLVLDCSDRFYGTPNNLLLPGLAASMGEGWETRRRRDDGNDWVLVRLGIPGTVRLLELDTSHFKGNAPGWAQVRVGTPTSVSMPADVDRWADILPRTRLQPDTRHRFPVVAEVAATHLRLDIFPDGGMARLRAYGAPG
jgi:allantoicase